MSNIHIKGKNFSLAVDLDKIENALQTTREQLSQKILDDCNVYSPVRTGKLRDTSHVYDEGIWYTQEYAEEVYDRDSVNTEINPNASPQWVDVAAAENMDAWTNYAREMLKRNIDG